MVLVVVSSAFHCYIGVAFVFERHWLHFNNSPIPISTNCCCSASNILLLFSFSFFFLCTFLLFIIRWKKNERRKPHLPNGLTSFSSVFHLPYSFIILNLALNKNFMLHHFIEYTTHILDDIHLNTFTDSTFVLFFALRRRRFLIISFHFFWPLVFRLANLHCKI